MSELRWNPFIKDWVIIAPKRQNRPELSKGGCPFCPGSGKVPENYEVFSFTNDYPSLSPNLSPAAGQEDEILRNREAYGRCEVILYSPDHDKSLWQLPVEHIEKLVDLWGQRFTALKKDKMIKYIYVFENRGETVGATISHPHGQIYAYSYIPKRLELENKAFQEYYKANNSCLMCNILKNELERGKGIITENEDFAAFVPSFTECPYGVYIVSKNHRSSLCELCKSEKLNFAGIIKDITGTYDALFGSRFPYMMYMHQSPVNGDGSENKFHFHVEFYSPVRSEKSLKINASGETGAWAHVNPTAPEEKAEELREAYERYKKMG